MKTLSTALLLEKNSISGIYPWLILLDVVINNSLTLYLVRNTEDITFAGQLYTAFPFEMDAASQKSKGELPSISLRVSNVTRAIQAHIEAQDGLIGNAVTIRIVNSNLLTEDYSELTETFMVLACEADVYWVTFTIGFPNPLLRRFPLDRFIADHCRYVSHFKGAECGYTGAVATCEGTLDDCRLKSNSGRFGGFPGLGKGGVKLV
jgi:phage-related protein